MNCKDCNITMYLEIESEFYDERDGSLEELHLKFICPKCFGTYRLIWEKWA